MKPKNVGGRGKRSIVTKKAYWLASAIGETAKQLSDRYEELSKTDPNEASKLLDGIESTLDIDVQSKLGSIGTK